MSDVIKELSNEIWCLRQALEETNKLLKEFVDTVKKDREIQKRLYEL